MAVFRVERTRDFTVMSNHHLRDKRLTLKAKGLLSMMLSLPEDWNYSTLGLGRHLPGGRGRHPGCPAGAGEGGLRDPPSAPGARRADPGHRVSDL